MRTPWIVAALFLAIILSIPSLGAAVVRDGSSFERAILVEGDYKHSVDWEWNYLKKTLRLPGLPKEQALTQHNGRTYDRFVFSDRVVFFDITRFEKQIFKKNNKSLEQMMKEAGIPVEKHK
jgi:hypothetical protein